MAAGVPIVSCSTPPVLEVLSHESNSLLSDFFDIESQVRNINYILDDPDLASRLSTSAQTIASKYSVPDSAARWSALLR